MYKLIFELRYISRAILILFIFIRKTIKLTTHIISKTRTKRDRETCTLWAIRPSLRHRPRRIENALRSDITEARGRTKGGDEGGEDVRCQIVPCVPGYCTLEPFSRAPKCPSLSLGPDEWSEHAHSYSSVFSHSPV